MAPVVEQCAWRRCAVLLAVVAGALLGVFACATEAAHATNGPHAAHAAAPAHEAVSHRAAAHATGAHAAALAHQAVSHRAAADATGSHAAAPAHGDAAGGVAGARPPAGPTDAPNVHGGHADLACLTVIELGAPALLPTGCVVTVDEPNRVDTARRSTSPDPPVPR